MLLLTHVVSELFAAEFSDRNDQELIICKRKVREKSAMIYRIGGKLSDFHHYKGFFFKAASLAISSIRFCRVSGRLANTRDVNNIF